MFQRALMSPVLLVVLMTAHVHAATPQESADWLKAIGAKIQYKEPTADLVLKGTDVDFNSVAVDKLVPADLAKLSAMVKLERVGFGNKAGTDANVAALVAAVPKIKALAVHNSAVTDAAFVEIAKLSQLTELTMFSTKVTPAAMASVAKLSNLKNLDVSSTAIGDTGLAAIKGLGLTTLSFNNMKGVTRAGMESIAALPKLDVLHLQFAEIDAELEALTKSKTLTLLALMKSKVTDVGAKSLGKITSLTELYLWKTEITDATLAALTGLTKLRVLYVSETKVTDAGMASVAKLGALETLWLDRTNVGDVGAGALAAHPKLKWFKADESKLTDAGVDKLLKIATLQTIEAKKTGVTDAGMAKFKAERPKGRFTK